MYKNIFKNVYKTTEVKKEEKKEQAKKAIMEGMLNVISGIKEDVMGGVKKLSKEIKNKK